MVYVAVSDQKIDMPAIQAIQAKSESIITTLKTTDEALFSTIKATNELDVYETTRLIPLETMGILKDAEGTFAYRVHQKRTIIGRHHELSDLVIASPAVGRKHAIITIDGYSVHIEDCNSKNGTRINGKRLEVGEVHTIKCGDLIELADFKLVYTTTV